MARGALRLACEMHFYKRRPVVDRGPAAGGYRQNFKQLPS